MALETDFKQERYKGFELTEFVSGVVVWSRDEVWMACSFDSLQTAKYFIDRFNYFKLNIYEVISQCQKKAIALKNPNISPDEKDMNIIGTDGCVTVDIIDQFELTTKFYCQGYTR